MPETFAFDTISPRFGLPLLFAGQAQKEAFVNEAHALADALLHCAVEGESATPPTNPADGENWLVSAGANGDWLGADGKIACRQGGNWIYVAPRDGLRVLDRSTGQEMRYLNGWQTATEPGQPTGGTTIDAEARAAISGLIDALRASGVFPAS